MKIALIGFNDTSLLSTLEKKFKQSGHDAVKFILTHLPGDDLFEISDKGLFFGKNNILKFDRYYFGNFRFFWPNNQVLIRTLENWDKFKENISDELTNFRESESIRSALIYILNSRKKLVNPISFFSLFEFRLLLFKLLEDNGVSITNYHITNDAIDKKISGKGNDQDYFSINSKEILEALELSDIMEIDTVIFPKIIKEGEECRRYSAYLIGNIAIFEDIDSSAKAKGLRFLKKVEQVLTSYLGTINYFCRLDFIFKAGIPMIYDIIPSPDVREEKILNHLVNLILKGGKG